MSNCNCGEADCRYCYFQKGKDEVSTQEEDRAEESTEVKDREFRERALNRIKYYTKNTMIQSFSPIINDAIAYGRASASVERSMLEKFLLMIDKNEVLFTHQVIIDKFLEERAKK